jgi:Interleukin-like EMT inducer
MSTSRAMPLVPEAARLSLRYHLAVLGSSLLLVALFTSPLILDPGHLLPLQGVGDDFHKDPMMYGWTMVSNTRRLLSSPLAVFHGNTFYPHGNVVAHSDLLLTPTLFPAGPVYLLTKNPVLQYNVTLLVWWALSGWAMYVLAFELLGSHAGATVAAVAFTLCPFRTDFFLEFQMQLAFPIPLALLALLRFLETHRTRDVAALLALVWVEALASMYYAIILGLCLVALTGLHVLLRPRAWSRRLVGMGALSVGVFLLALTPFLLPYIENARELGLVRELNQPARHSADILTYGETGPTRLYEFSPSGHIAETSLFMGFVALALAAWGLVSPAPSEGPDPPRGVRITRRLLAAAGVGVVAVTVVTLVARRPLRAAGLHVARPLPLLLALLLVILLRLAVEGWWATRRGRQGRLGVLELRWVTVSLIVLFFLLSLGPEIHYRRVALGPGLYAYLYRYVLPLHAMRITSRIGVIVVLGVGLLAGMGVQALETRLGSPWGRPTVAILLLAMLAEYAPFPLPYGRFDWEHPPPVYRALAADPDDVVVLELPMNLEDPDDLYTFTSLYHGKRIVNGASGFSPMGPPMTRHMSEVLVEPDRADDPFPNARVRRYLLGLHPLRYVIVHNALLHNALLDPAEQSKWQNFQRAPWVRLVGRYGDDDLYRLTGSMQGRTLEKYVSWDYARDKTTLAMELRTFGLATGTNVVDVELNGQRLGQRALGSGWTPVELPLVGRRTHSAPNVFTIRLQYRGNDASRPIGRTGVLSPVDLFVVSGGKDAGDVASVMVNGYEVARNQRGYNVVAIDSGTGDVLWSDVFDCFGSPRESARLADAIARVPLRTVVAAAVKDEASGGLSDEAVAALRSLGGREDVRGRFRVSHLLVGVKGAPPGTAIEEAGYRRLVLTLGAPPEEVGVELREFTLR